MSEVQQKRTCSQCGNEKNGRFCPSCNTETPSTVHISVSDTIRVHSNLRARKFTAGIKKFVSEYLGGWFSSGDPKLPDGVEKSRVIDREKDEYHEIVKKYGTDEVIHENHEPLSKHKK